MPLEEGTGLTLDEKLDQIMKQLANLRDMMQYIPEMSIAMEAMKDQQDELLEAIQNLTNDNTGFGIEDLS